MMSEAEAATDAFGEAASPVVNSVEPMRERAIEGLMIAGGLTRAQAEAALAQAIDGFNRRDDR